MNLVLITQPTITFRWKDRKDNFHIPTHMETRHVFMTLVMIWNHTMPADAVITKSGNWVHHMYRLGSHYGVDYLSIAIGSLARELFTRTDLEPAWLAESVVTRLTLQLLNSVTGVGSWSHVLIETLSLP